MPSCVYSISRVFTSARAVPEIASAAAAAMSVVRVIPASLVVQGCARPAAKMHGQMTAVPERRRAAALVRVHRNTLAGTSGDPGFTRRYTCSSVSTARCPGLAEVHREVVHVQVDVLAHHRLVHLLRVPLHEVGDRGVRRARACSTLARTSRSTPRERRAASVRRATIPPSGMGAPVSRSQCSPRSSSFASPLALRR